MATRYQRRQDRCKFPFPFNLLLEFENSQISPFFDSSPSSPLNSERVSMLPRLLYPSSTASLTVTAKFSPKVVSPLTPSSSRLVTFPVGPRPRSRRTVVSFPLSLKLVTLAGKSRCKILYNFFSFSELDFREGRREEGYRDCVLRWDVVFTIPGF